MKKKSANFSSDTSEVVCRSKIVTKTWWNRYRYVTRNVQDGCSTVLSLSDYLHLFVKLLLKFSYSVKIRKSAGKFRTNQLQFELTEKKSRFVARVRRGSGKYRNRVRKNRTALSNVAVRLLFAFAVAVAETKDTARYLPRPHHTENF